MQAARWLVVVAPHAANGGPDIKRMQAFIAGPDAGIIFGADIWHHPLTVLDGPGSFAIGMWRAGDDGGRGILRSAGACHRLRLSATPLTVCTVFAS